MKKILAFVALTYSAFALSATQVPVQLLNPAGSTAGQTIVSTGPATAPGWATVPLSGLSSIASNTVLANATASAAAPSAFSMPSCSSTGNALNWTTNTGFTCQTGLAPLASPTFTGTATVANITATGTITGFPGRLLAVQVFSASGTYTPTTGTGRAIIRVQAPGGGGGGSTTTGSGQVSIAQGGSAGSYAEVYWTSPSSQTVTIGAVGAAGAAGGSGGTGGTTSVGAIVSCPGGIGGATQAASTPPLANGGAAAPSACTVSGATLTLSRQGSAGQVGAALSATQYWPVQGGISSWGAYTTGYGFGGFGSAIGQSTSGAAGSAGGAGFIIVYDYQ